MDTREDHDTTTAEPGTRDTADTDPSPGVVTNAAVTADVPEHARELARSLVRVTLVNVTLALLVAVTNWDTYPVWARAGVIAAGGGALAVGALLRRRALTTPADADERSLKRLGRRLLATLLATHLPLMTFAAAGVMSF